MPKHNHSKSLGNISDFSSVREMPPVDPVDPFELRIAELEKRVATLEMLLNEVCIQLDNPVRDQQLDGKPKCKHRSKPKSKSPDTGAKPKLSKADMVAQEKAKSDRIIEVNMVLDAMRDGKKRTYDEIFEKVDLSRKGVRRGVRRLIDLGLGKADDDVDRKTRLFWIIDTANVNPIESLD